MRGTPVHHGRRALLLILAALVAFSAVKTAESTVSQSFAGTDSSIPNPERGFYRAGQQYLDALDRASFAKAYADGFRLVYARIDLAPYRNSALPSAFLSKLDDAAGAARSAGVKLIVRAVYNYPAGETAYRQAQDAPLPTVLKHIDQLKAFFTGQEDVIAFVQAGFVGAWGEWHTSSNELTAPRARGEIRAALLSAVPAGRFLQFRYPPYLAAWSPRLPSLRAALDGSFRTGFHNDCFLASTTDVGTFSEQPRARKVERSYADALGDLAPFGGETCNPADDPGAAPRSNCSDILNEGARFNLTYLNDGYYRPLFHQRWASQGCAEEVSRRMGYRFRLVEARHAATAQAGTTFAWSATVANDGWARLYNHRAMQLVLRSRADGSLTRLRAGDVDPRTWLPGRRSQVEAKIVIPAVLAPADYEILVALPDPSPRLSGDPRYSIRFANARDRSRGQDWDDVAGAFATGSFVRVERAQSERM